jgi:lipoyl(octanoyl) transferase
MELWFQLIEPAQTPAYNMACDEWLLYNLPRFGRPILRIYGWDRPALSIGYFQSYKGKDASKTLVRRPTGGGTVDHTQDETYSVLLPKGHEWCLKRASERYRAVHEVVRNLFLQRSLKTEILPCQPAAATRRDGNCYEQPTSCDLMMDGQKVGGGAQRMTRAGLLHQGTLLKMDKSWGAGEWVRGFGMAGIRLEPLKLSREMKQEIQVLAHGKYNQSAWNEKR